MECVLYIMRVMALSHFVLFSCAAAMAVDPLILPKQILVFGGNGMIGSATVERLIPLEHKLVLVNRGGYYWDSAFTISPFVQHLACDRWQRLEKCQSFTDYLSSVSSVDVVIDFSAYHPDVLKGALDLLKQKAKLYVYISTDSVYEVCAKNHSELSLETDAVRPVDEEEREKKNSNDMYGHHKLQCEETLREYRQKGTGPPFISLRLPDVIGPRDNTGRWWTYQLWMKLQPFLEKQIAVRQDIAAKRMSFVYVNDVADLIFNLVENPVEEAFDEAFNLALEETRNITAVLKDIKDELNLTEVEIAVSDDHETMRLFPSVTLGPVNITKAERILNWKPTDWHTALKKTVQFYEDALSNPDFDRERNAMIRKFQAHFTSEPNDILLGLDKMYGLNFGRRRDEL